MAKQSASNIDLKPVLYVGGFLLMYPLIKSVFTLFGLGVDILSAPGKLADYLNKQTDKQIHDLVYEVLWKMARNSNYDSKNTKDVAMLREIKMMTGLTSEEKFSIIATWQFFKADVYFKSIAKDAADEIIYNITHKLW